MSQPRPAAEYLKEILAEVGSRSKREKFASALREVLGSETARHCRVLGFRGGRLTVEVDSAPLFSELVGFRREETRTAMNQILRDQKIAAMVFRMGGAGNV